VPEWQWLSWLGAGKNHYDHLPSWLCGYEPKGNGVIMADATPRTVYLDNSMLSAIEQCNLDDIADVKATIDLFQLHHDGLIRLVASRNSMIGTVATLPNETDIADDRLHTDLVGLGLSDEDALHLTNAGHKGHMWFVTCDRGILKRARDVEQLCRVRVCRASELVQEMTIIKRV
jgi:hypothetical protein